ncbi:hypothetical protein N7474_005911 [Penicillium riverlandense]|uniref:uncharacterized protein n=1 Tax=Penicillium riverlandense TaxID=1903569 RepID=UPI002547DFED|nr:uncharacterized protein N7474_005911 [Penicillium riverlandense]KAJ5820320.1 hypothetical protein N7474_005911 [Penicillium riverlandense]
MDCKDQRTQLSQQETAAIQEKIITFNPPFRKEHELQNIIPIFPTYHAKTGFNPQRPILDILNQELRTPSIDKIYSHLWLAGLPKAARPLHRQNLLGRTIVITENPEEHLIWLSTRIFIKPLPEYLLCHEFWMTKGSILTQDQSLYQCACGFLLSYCWLICSKSDLAIAHSSHLLPSSITWEKWIPFVTDILTNIDPETLHSVSPRYHYGELRLSRLNAIYSFAPDIFTMHNFVHGFMAEPSRSKAFLERNFAWLFSVFGFITIVASAMQVGWRAWWEQQRVLYLWARFGAF